MNIIEKPASISNYSRGRNYRPITCLVIHVMDGTMKGTAAWFANPDARVSAHYGIGASGEIHQYVNDEDTAWHSGDFDTNLTSIGLEHEGRKGWIPTLEQYDASVELAATLCQRYAIQPTAKTILRHSTVSSKKPDCPGDGFPIEQYISDIAGRLDSPTFKEWNVKTYGTIHDGDDIITRISFKDKTVHIRAEKREQS